jgi:SAM-dependent methyltransferase
MKPLHLKAALWLATACSFCTPAWAQEEVPFITTPDHVTLAMLQLAGVTAGDFVLDLGSGDGRIVITAARQFQATGLGVEIVPDLVQKSRANARLAGVAGKAEFREQDLFATDLRVASVITMYLLPEVNLQLRPALLALAPGTRIVSHDWNLGDWQPDKSLTLEVPTKSVGRDKRSTLHLWVVPARVQGLWCSAGAQLEVTQRFQHFSATLRLLGAKAETTAPVAVFDGKVSVNTLLAGAETAGSSHSGTQLQVHSSGMDVVKASGAVARFVGQRFVAARAGGCP